MASNKQTPPTKTIAFRWPSDVVDHIREEANKQGMSMQDFFFTQISPGSALMKFIIMNEEKMVADSKAFMDMRENMIADAKRIMEETGMSQNDMANGVADAIKALLQSNK